MELSKLKIVFNRFSMKDLCEYVLWEFPEITLSLEQLLSKCRLTVSKKNVIKVLLLSIETSRFNDNDIELRINRLLLLAIHKSIKYTWTAYRMLRDETRDEFPDLPELIENMKNNLQKDNKASKQTYILHSLYIDTVFVISIEKKLKKKRISTAVYLKHYPGFPYFFLSTKRFDDQQFLNTFVQCLSYKNWTECRLSGKDVNSLFQLLRNEDGAFSDPSLLVLPERFSPKERIEKFGDTNGVSVRDFNYANSRAQYADDLFGKNPPHLETYSVTVEDDGSNTPVLNKISLAGVSLTFCAPNVTKFMKEMIADGLISIPLPSYAENLLTKASNKVHI